jgi:hypothetical protein
MFFLKSNKSLKMKSKSLFILLFALISWYAYSQDSVTINSAVKFQTITGWGHGGGVYGGITGFYTILDSAVANPVNYQVLDFLVDDLGLTGTRTYEVGPRTDGTGMDDGDCDSINWSKFDQRSLSVQMAHNLVHFKNRIIANGYQPNFYSSPGYPTHATELKPWVLNHPGERAQQIWASALYMKNTYGIIINYDVIYNEPSSPVTSAILVDDIKALAPRLVAKGLITRSQFSESMTPQSAWNLINPLQNDSIFWKCVGRISYHNYGTADPYRSYIRDFGLSKGITTAQTEMGSPTFDDMYSDLTQGGVSYWEVAFSSGNTIVPISGLTSFTPSNTYFRLRQTMHYVRPGAVRIEATSNNSLLHVLAFSNNGAITTIIENTSSTTKTINLSGLLPGNYGLSQASQSATSFQEFGIRTVGADGKLIITVNGGSATATLYPYSGTNQPPTIMTWKPNPGYLVAPASTATLSATACDPELNTLTYHWTTISYPAGAIVSLSTPNAATSSVSGLTVAGTYVFNVDVQDGVNTSSKKLYLIVYATNPEPVLGDAGFRISAPYGLVFSAAGDTTHANIELPTSSATLQVGISDLANSDFTGRGLWTLVSQPAGANAVVGSTTYIYVSIRANVTGMTVPGDYIFQVNVTNPGHPDLTARIICTVHPTSTAPFITSITPFPASITQPVNTVRLTAITGDNEGDLLRHWWMVKTVPAGANPLFEHQGLKVTNVSGLNVPGNYTFTLRAFDDLHMTTKDVSVLVIKGNNTSSTISPTACFSYVSPSGKYTWTHSGTYMDTIPNAAGYDSLITINLTINTVDTSVVKNGPILTANVTGALYNWLDCGNGFATINGATNQSFTATKNGDYAVRISINGCIDTSACYNITGLLINENSDEGLVYIYPNPVLEEINVQIEGNSNKISKLFLSDQLGQKVMEQNIRLDQTGKITISVKTLPTGVYYLSLQTREKTIISRIIKQ